MSMPPVDAPERITIPNENPIITPAKIAQSMGSFVKTKFPAARLTVQDKDNKSRDQCCRRKFLSEFQPTESEHGDIKDRHKAGERDPEVVFRKKSQARGPRPRSCPTEG